MNGKFYNINKLLTYNTMLSLVIGGRGIGKTFATKKYCLENFLKKGKQAIYLRRTEAELDNIDKEKFFTTELLKQCFKGFLLKETKTTRQGTKITFLSDDLKDFDIEEHELQLNSRRITLDGKIVFYLKALSTSIKLKGSEYDDVDTVMFDEFLIDENDNRLRYLNNEIELFFNLMNSVFRQRTNGRAILLANATNINNPYFNYLQFVYDDNKIKRYNYIKKYGVVIEFPPNKIFDEKKEDINNNKFYKLIQDTKTFESVVNNKFHIKRDNNIFTLKGRKDKHFQILIEKNKVFTIYSQNDIMYVDDSYDKNVENLTFNLELVELGAYYINRNNYVSAYIRRKFYSNQIIYSSLDVKFSFQNSIQGII